MNAYRYIKRNNLPPTLPLYQALLWWLLLDRLNAPGWAFGVMWTIAAILAAASLIVVILGEPVDVVRSAAFKQKN